MLVYKLGRTYLKFGCNFVSCKIRMGFLGTLVQNSSAKENQLIKYILL